MQGGRKGRPYIDMVGPVTLWSARAARAVSEEVRCIVGTLGGCAQQNADTVAHWPVLGWCVHAEASRPACRKGLLTAVSERLSYNERMQILVARSDNRPFELARFDAAWARAGGDPSELVFVTPSTATEVAAPDAVFGGLLLTGGPDVEPARYRARPEPGVKMNLDRERDALDLGLLERAEREGWPVLAVCYGCQVMNVFYGGTLIQDLDRAGKPDHYVAEPKDHLAHVVRKCGRGGGRWLDSCPEEFLVNSRHHQAIGEVAPPLDVILTAPDGVVEAVKLRHISRLAVGVQWHPENLMQAEHVSLFRAFRSACLAPFAVHGPRSTIPGAR